MTRVLCTKIQQEASPSKRGDFLTAMKGNKVIYLPLDYFQLLVVELLGLVLLSSWFKSL